MCQWSNGWTASSLSHIQTQPTPKGSSWEAQQHFCAASISHVSLLKHTHRSAQCSLPYEGQVLACPVEKLQPKSFLSLHTFPLSPVSHVFPVVLPQSPPPFYIPLYRRICTILWGRSSLKVIQNCTATTNPPPPLSPPPSAPQGAWIPLNRAQSCSKSRPGLITAPAAGLIGCPTAAQRDRKVGGLG